jgi:hypothetical protein
MSKSKKILFEDFNKIYNKWVSGIAKREAPSNVITVDDIVNQYRNNMNHEAPKELPYPLDKSLPMLGDIFTKLSDYKNLIEQSTHNPLIGKNKANIKQLEKVWMKMQTIQDILFSITVNLNKIVQPQKEEDIENSETDSN